MILVWGSRADSPVAAVIDALQQSGEQFIVLDQQALLEAELDLFVDEKVHGNLRIGAAEIDLGAIRGIYLRPYEPPRSGIDPRDEPGARLTALNDALLAWSEITPARVLNRPSAMASNHSKPYQAGLIHAQGFNIPETLMTTDPGALEIFWKRHGNIIYKSASGIRSIVSRLTPAHRDRFTDLVTCPTQFQEFIEGVDVRVHVVGHEIFASRIVSLAADYRYPRTENEQPKIEAFDLPAAFKERCRNLASSLSLDLAGIDFRRADDGRWFCFEVNPSPGFTYFEQATGQPIARSIARLLASAAYDPRAAPTTSRSGDGRAGTGWPRFPAA